MIEESSMIIDILLEELVEFSRITGTPVHELLGIPKEKFEEWLNEHEQGRKPMLRTVVIPKFKVDP